MSLFTPNGQTVVGTTALALSLGISPQKVRNLATRGIIPRPEGHRNFNFLEAVNAYTEHLREQAAGRNLDAETKKLKVQKLKAETLIATLKAQEIQGRLIPVAEVSGRWVQSARIVRSSLLSVASRAASRLNLSTAQTKDLETEILTALEDLSEQEEVA